MSKSTAENRASAHGFGEQLRSIESELVDGWQVKASPKSGNPLYVRPSVLVVYREDQRFLLDDVIPRRGQTPAGNFDLAVISQPWRARMGADRGPAIGAGCFIRRLPGCNFQNSAQVQWHLV